MLSRKNFSRLVLLSCILVMLVQPFALAAENIRLDILTINDFHGALLEEGKTPGAAKLSGFIKEVRSQNPRGTVLVSAGDMFQGTVRSNILYGKPVIEMMNAMNFATMAIGNHEFDWGIDVLHARAKEAKFPMIAANITNKDTGKAVNFTVPYIVKKINGINVGLIGITTPETAYTSNISVVSKYNFNDPAETVKRVYRKIKGAGAEVIVVVGHLGSAQSGDVISGEAVDMINAISGTEYKVDAVISAHTHNVVKGKVQGIPIVQAGSSGRNVGSLVLYYSPDEKTVVDSSVDVLGVSENQKAYRKVEKIVARSAKKAHVIENTIIGSTEGLAHDRHTLSQLGMWATDAMREITNVDIAVTNGGGLRKPIAPGKITLGTIYDIAPFDNTVITMQMTGKQIREIFEFGLDSQLGLLQYSGVNIVYDASRVKGNKIVSIKLVNGEELSDDALYSICTNDFLAEGGDGYTFFKQGKDIYNTNIVFRSVLIEAVEKAGDVVFAEDGRFEEQTVGINKLAS